MADGDDEVSKLEKEQQAIAARLQKLKAQQIHEPALIKAGQNGFIERELRRLGTDDGFRVEVPTRQMTSDVSASITYRRNDGTTLQTHQKLSEAAKDAILQKAGIDDGVPRDVYVRTQKGPRTLMDADGHNVQTIVERTEYIVAKHVASSEAIVLPKAVLTEETTTDKSGRLIGNSSVTMVDGKPTQVHVEYADGRKVDQTVTAGPESLEIETTRDGTRTTSSFDKRALVAMGQQLQGDYKELDGRVQKERAGTGTGGQEKTNEEKFQEVANRLTKVFGREVKVSSRKDRDFNGVPNFLVTVGVNKAEAEAVIDKLVQARNGAGLTRTELPLRSDSRGNVVIYGGDILNYGRGDSDVIDTTFNKLENTENAKRFQKAFPGQSGDSMSLNESKRLTPQRFAQQMPKLTGQEPVQFSDPQRPSVLGGGQPRSIV